MRSRPRPASDTVAALAFFVSGWPRARSSNRSPVRDSRSRPRSAGVPSRSAVCVGVALVESADTGRGQRADGADRTGDQLHLRRRRAPRLRARPARGRARPPRPRRGHARRRAGSMASIAAWPGGSTTRSMPSSGTKTRPARRARAAASACAMRGLGIMTMADRQCRIGLSSSSIGRRCFAAGMSAMRVGGGHARVSTLGCAERENLRDRVGRRAGESARSRRWTTCRSRARRTVATGPGPAAPAARPATRTVFRSTFKNAVGRCAPQHWRPPYCAS